MTSAIKMRSRRLKAVREKMGAVTIKAEMRSMGHKKV